MAGGAPGGKEKGCQVLKIFQNIWLVRCRFELPIMVGNFISTQRRKAIPSKRKTNATKAFCLGVARLLAICLLELRKNRTGNVNKYHKMNITEFCGGQVSTRAHIQTQLLLPKPYFFLRSGF